jgi:branched-chain amino acid transport system ATP-binding protein
MKKQGRSILVIDALKIDHIDAYYSDSHVLHGVSLSLKPGHVLALLGRNGAGKSTWISSIMGLVAPKNGSIKLFGQEIAGLAPETISKSGIGLVPQGRRIFPSLTVRENLVVARQRENAQDIENDKRWTLERIFGLFPRLQERQQQLAGSLSGGEQQMLALGRALMGNPRVLLLDEPSEGLAPLIVAEVGRTIARLKAEGQSIILVEQNSDLALSLADDVVILNTGRVVFAGPAVDVRNNEALIVQHLGIFHGH